MIEYKSNEKNKHMYFFSKNCGNVHSFLSILRGTWFKQLVIKESSTIKDPIIYLILNEMKGQDWVTH
jgi:hypothetical protein